MTSPVTERRRGRGWLIASLAVVGVIAVAAVIVLLSVLNRPAEQTAPTPAPSSTDPASATATTQGACGPVPYEKTNTLTAAPDTTWEPWGGNRPRGERSCRPREGE